MFKKTILAAVMCAAANTGFAATSVKLGTDAVLTGGDYTTGGGLTVAIEPRDIGGRLGLCGVWAQSDTMSIYTRDAASLVLGRGVASLNGQVIARDFRFLNRVRPSASYAGAPANCVILDRAWQAQYGQGQLDLRIPRQKIFTSSIGRTNAPRVFFTRSDSANPALGKGSFLPNSVTSYSSHKTQ